MHVDTVAAMLVLGDALDVALFHGGTVSHDFGSSRIQSRLYRNPLPFVYEPRVTYWPASLRLRVEWSCLRMSLDDVNVWLRNIFGVLPDIREWMCQRIDYVCDLAAGERMPEYLLALGRVPLGSWERQEYAGEGVVWKSGARWVKFYDASKRHGLEPGTLRFEVSNLRDGVRYMAQEWFVCARTVGELARPGRAAFVLALYWDKLGLGRVSEYGSKAREVYALRSAFGVRRLGGARHALECIKSHGAESYKSLGLMSKSSYYRWLNELRVCGLLACANGRALDALELSLEYAFDASLAWNLKSSEGPQDAYKRLKKMPEKIRWLFLSEKLGFNRQLPEIPYLLERFSEYLGAGNLDGATAAV